MEALYRRMLRLYPPDYREMFADEMLAVFRQARADAWGRSRAARAAFCLREIAGMLCGAAEERWRAAGWPPVTRRSTVRSSFRYPKATIVLMIVIFAATVVAIERATQISVSMPRVNPHVPPLAPLPPSFPQTLAILFGVTYAVAAIVWAVLHVLRRSGEHRLNDAQTWPQRR